MFLNLIANPYDCDFQSKTKLTQILYKLLLKIYNFNNSGRNVAFYNNLASNKALVATEVYMFIPTINMLWTIFSNEAPHPEINMPRPGDSLYHLAMLEIKKKKNKKQKTKTKQQQFYKCETKFVITSIHADLSFK